MVGSDSTRDRSLPASSSSLGNLPQTQGPAATDYAVYTKEDITLRKGEKAIVQLFAKNIEYSHLYRWSPPQEIQHFLVLNNNTDTPWTTGPCLAVSGNRPLGEDLLKYTPKGSDGELPVTTAVNVAGDKSEREVGRKLKAHKPAKDRYLDMVTLKGTLTIKNHEPETISLKITNPVPGMPVEASDDGIVKTDSKKLVLSKRSGTIRWDVDVKPGETKELTYTYERYVPSN